MSVAAPITRTEMNPETNTEPAFTAAFATREQCRAWLARQKLANPPQLLGALNLQLSVLNMAPLAVAERMDILEQLRESAIFVLGECAKRFIGRPLPLAPAEQGAFEANRRLWRVLQDGYGRCLGAAAEGDHDAQPLAGLAAQRWLAALGAELLDTYHALQAVPAGFWQRLHAAYAMAERLGVADSAVTDRLRPTYRRSVAPAHLYCAALLLHAASPYELSARKLGLVHRWLGRWSRKAVLGTVAPPAARTPPLLVDLDADAPAGFHSPGQGSLRWLDTGPLRHTLKRRLQLLQQGAQPAALKLGDELDGAACAELIDHLYRRWCKGANPRRQLRQPAARPQLVTTGFAAIHYYLTGRPFRESAFSTDYTRQHNDELAIFGHLSHQHEAQFLARHEIRLEQWQVRDESPNGLRIARASGSPGHRLGRGQLLALRNASGEGYTLGSSRWVQIEAGGELLAGIILWPGAPRGVTAGPAEAGGERYQRAILLPEVAALGEPASLILPPNSFRADRRLTLMSEAVTAGEALRGVRLTRLIERGSDYDRAEFTYT